jgi:hypothetical protein
MLKTEGNQRLEEDQEMKMGSEVSVKLLQEIQEA